MGTTENRHNSRQKIIDTALELFSQQGFEKTSVREIARTASVSLGLMYNYFNGKSALLKAIMQDGIEAIQQSFESVPEKQDRLYTLIIQYFLSLEKKKKHWRLLHGIRMQAHLNQLLAEESEWLQNYIIGELALILREMGYDHPVHEAVLLFASLDGISSHYLTNQHYPLEKMIHLLTDKYPVR